MRASRKCKESMKSLIPSTLRKLQKLEKGDREGPYIVSKQIDILRLKLKINDFISAIFGVGHGWLMFGEKITFEKNYFHYHGTLT